MGTSTKSIPFFTDAITIIPHTVGGVDWMGKFARQYLDREVSIRDFCAGQPCSLHEVLENGEYIVRRKDGGFMQGPEI